MSKFVILMQSDDNYAPFMGVALTSLFENNKALNAIDIAIIDNGLNEDNKSRLQGLCDKYNRKLIFIPAQGVITYLEENNLPKLRGSYSTYLKLFVLDKLSEYDKAIYLDADVIVAGNISGMVDMDLGDNVVAMALDVEPVIRKLQGISEPEKWYNAGVMVFNVPVYLNKNGQKLVMDFIKNNKLTLYFHEQDIINTLFRNEILEMSNRFNMQTIYLHIGLKNAAYVYDWSEQMLGKMQGAANNPVIYHCFTIMGRRPWHKKYAMESTVKFDYYLALSTYSDYVKEEPSIDIVNKVQRVCFILLPRALYARIYKVLYMKKMRGTFSNNPLC